MSNIESIFKKERHVWICPCGNCGFLIYDDGGAECTECEKPAPNSVVQSLPVIRTERKYDQTNCK